jgi:fibronectin type 3 domain-containing protein
VAEIEFYSAGIPGNIVPAPTGLVAQEIPSGQINLTWVASLNAISYTVKRSTTSGGPYATLADDITATSYGDTNTAPGETYYYVVSANTADDHSADSDEATPLEPHAHLTFDETAGTTAADATGNGWNGTLVNGPTWTAGNFDNAVNLDGSDDLVTLPTGVVDGLTDVTISTWVYLNTASQWSRIFDFGNDTTVYMFLTPNNGSGVASFAITTSGNSNEDIISGFEALPTGAWTHVAVSIGGGTGVLYVNGNEVGRNSSMTLTPDSLGATTNNMIGFSQYDQWDPHLNGRVDEFRIYPVALSGDQIGILMNESIPDQSPLTPANLMTDTVSISEIDLTWDASAEATNYNIKRSTNSGGPYTIIAGTGGTSFSDTGLDEGTTYYYVVSAVNAAGESSDSVESEGMTLAIPPSAPTGLAAAAGDQTVALSWDANSESDIAGYNVYRSTTQGSGYALLNVSLLPNLEYTDHTANNFTRYFYVVTAVDTDTLESGYSNEVEALPNDGTLIQISGTDFESGLGDWVNLSGDDTHDWTRDSGGTLTPSTGPSTGANGSSWYAYLETSPGGASSAGDTAILESPVIGGIGRLLSFDYHMYGVESGTLSVDVYDGVWHYDVWTLSGQQQTSSTDEYIRATLDLSNYNGSIQIRLRATASGGPRGDMAIDNIDVTGRIIYGDMDGDGVVNGNDLSDFISNWLQVNCDMDLDGDCIITMYEFSEFSRCWLDSSN